MSSLISGTKDAIHRIPWKEYISSILYKAIGVIVVSLILIGCMYFSSSIDLTTISPSDSTFIITMLFSSTCYILVLAGFIKIILFDMAEEFGLRDVETRKLVLDARFFFFAILAFSFCSAIYTLLDVFLGDTYLQLLPFVIFDWVLVEINVDIPGLTDKMGLEYYQTIRNILFDFFFIIIIAFSVIVFLAILTTLARMRIQRRFKDEETYEVEEETAWFRKFLLWVVIPPITVFFALSQDQLLQNPVYRSISVFLYVILILFIIWWVYQLVKTIFRILWRGLEITAFLTSVNFLLIFPLVFIGYIVPVLLWTGYDVLIALSNDVISFEILQMLDHAFIALTQQRWFDIQSIIYLDFVFITIIATMVIGFAEGYAILAIFSAITKGAAVARTGQMAVRSPPKIMVISKYLLMLAVWMSLIWEYFRSIWQMLMDELFIALPDIEIPRIFYIIHEGVVALADWLSIYWPMFKDLPFLILPLFFILAASFKFFSVTLVTPRVKDRLLVFFLLVSTAFVLIITQILGDIYNPAMNITDAPLMEFAPILIYAVKVFTYVEAVAFYGGFLFGIIWLIRKFVISRKKTSPNVTSEESTPDLKVQLPVED